MLSLTGKNGDQLEVTFVLGMNLKPATEEHINGRCASLVGERADVKIGDKCRILLVDCESPDGPRHVALLEVVKPGDGRSSLLEKTFHDIIGGLVGERLTEPEVFRALRTRCSDEHEMLEILLDVVEAYSYETKPSRRPLRYGHYCIVIARLINKLHADDAQKRIALYERAAAYCAADEGGREWADSFNMVAELLRH